MKATFFHAPRDIRLADVPDAEPGPGQVLLDVTAVGICGSDLHTYLYGNIGGVAAEQPLTLGHEAGGVVVAVGPGVQLRPGQRVAIDPAVHCGECERCQAGEPHLCLKLEFMGLYPYHGALRERMVYPARSCVPVPNSITDIGAAMLEPLGVALHATRLAEIQIGEDVAVLGCGAIGLLIVRLARLAGARRIFASDNHPWRLNAAAAYGANVLLNAGEVDVAAEVLRLTDKRGVDVAIEAAWAADTTGQCVEMARYGGRVIIVGIPIEDFVTFRASAARRKELLIRPSRRMKHTYPAAIALAESGQVDLDGLASHQYSLEQTPTAFEDAATYCDGIVRAVVLPNHR
ncbi:MAG: alcohol dehydrogenase catalytic domain-containing protein [Chloroflexi bacterium]|nr:alcohol dehydrogenase catalytic domain-containing protein [Chloroflexota bacterium]